VVTSNTELSSLMSYAKIQILQWVPCSSNKNQHSCVPVVAPCVTASLPGSNKQQARETRGHSAVSRLRGKTEVLVGTHIRQFLRNPDKAPRRYESIAFSYASILD